MCTLPLKIELTFARFMNFRVERLPDKQKNFMDIVSENFEKRNKETGVQLKRYHEAAANAKKDKAEAEGVGQSNGRRGRRWRGCWVQCYKCN